ncbi:hypothetical protein PAMP_003991 [Pampus punctatissimus]
MSVILQFTWLFILSQFVHRASTAVSVTSCGETLWLLLDEISLEGMVVHRAECRPVVNDNYMKLKN